MHGKPLNLLIFVVIMGPLIWFSQKMNWGDTGTFVCVVVGIVGGFVLMRSSRAISKRVKRTFSGGAKGAAADFLLSPSQPGDRQHEMLQMRQYTHHNVGAWNAPALPHPQRRPGPYAPAPRTRIIPESVAPAAPPTIQTIQGNSYHPTAQPPSRRAPQQQPIPGGPLLELGPGAQMYLATSLTSAIVVDAQPRRLAAPVFLEEWINHGLGLLVVDTTGHYAGYLAHMSSGFGFLAGSNAWQDQLTGAQQGRYMPLEMTADATHVGQSIVDERLQIIFNISSYQDTNTAGTLLLALLAGIERRARDISAKPCAILLTDTQAFLPARDEDCLIENAGLAQQVFDLLMDMLEHAGLPGLKYLALYLAMPKMGGIAEDALTASRLWIVNSMQQEDIDAVSPYMDLVDEDIDQLLEGDVLLFDVVEEATTFVRFRRAALSKTWQLPALQRQTDALEGGEPEGESLGLKTQKEEA